MGGGSSEIHDASTTVLLEAANFNPINTRKTSAALRLSTEASYRFERGIRAELAPRALRRATRLILEIAGGKAARGIVDLYPGRKETPPARISDRRIKQVLGAEIPMAEVERVLDSLGFERARGLPDNASAAEEDSTLWVNVPYWRSDISLEDDLVEEVARIVGYDAIPTTMLSARVPHHEPQPMRSLTERIKDLLAAAGMQEIISYSLTTLEKLDRVGALRGAPQPLKIANPLSGEMEYLRTSLRGSMLETVASNRRTSQGDGMRLFEQGRVYLPQDGPGALALPHEREMLVGALSGPRVRTSWLAPQGDMDFFDAKGVVESMFRQLGVGVEFERSTDPVLHPGRTARLLCSGNPIGVVGEVRPDVLERFDIEDAQVAMFEIDLEALSRAAGPSRRYQSSSRFPESYRDLALIVDEDAPSAGLLAIIEGHKLVARATPFDVYSGQGVPQGKKSVAYRLVFQSASGTLIAQQVDRAQQDILRRLERELGAELRG
jgi:phenylalanyl-tRNA synthetase beta chain